VDALARVPQWERVELMRSTRDSRAGHDAIVFRIECLDREASP
jgi:hypothetical protein